VDSVRRRDIRAHFIWELFSPSARGDSRGQAENASWHSVDGR